MLDVPHLYQIMMRFFKTNPNKAFGEDRIGGFLPKQVLGDLVKYSVFEVHPGYLRALVSLVERGKGFIQ